jgi:hypothetical protein
MTAGPLVLMRLCHGNPQTPTCGERGGCRVP